MGLLSSIFGKKDKDDERRSSAAKPDFGNVSSGTSSTSREIPKPTPAPGPLPPTGSAPGGKTYEIQKGDTLSAIAQRHYGKASEWRRIHEANRDVIKDPDKIYPGQKITIPDA
jgi:nucleoid-associated protein YgaU